MNNVNEIYLGMYRTAVQSGRLPIDYVPEPYRTMLMIETSSPETEGGELE